MQTIKSDSRLFRTKRQAKFQRLLRRSRKIWRMRLRGRGIFWRRVRIVRRRGRRGVRGAVGVGVGVMGRMRMRMRKI